MTQYVVKQDSFFALYEAKDRDAAIDAMIKARLQGIYVYGQKATNPFTKGKIIVYETDEGVEYEMKENSFSIKVVPVPTETVGVAYPIAEHVS